MPQAKHAYITPKLPRALPPAARKLVEAAVETHFAAAEAHSAARDALIAFLDDEEPDPDLEPSLGGMRPLSGVEEFDLEQDVGDDGEADQDSDKDLGWTGDINQERSLKSCHGEIFESVELEHDGREPSLGAPERNFAGWSPSGFSQTGWGEGAIDDRENDGDDREPDCGG